MMAFDTLTPAILVAGMHRSGTSFVASLLHRAGCTMGEALLPADRHNRPGYFEDVDFLDLDRRMLAATTPVGTRGHVDWGCTDGAAEGGVDPARLTAFVDEADALIAGRRAALAASGAAWGWKDPRASLLLDFWRARLPEARVVMIYRAPWDVADSMQRLGADPFLRDPAFAYRAWRHYNRALLAFARTHRDRTIVLHAGALLRAPHRLTALVRERFGIALDARDADAVADPALFAAIDPGDRRATLAAAMHPGCVETLRGLEAIADLPSGDPLPAPLAAPVRLRARGAEAADEAAVAIVIPCHDDGAFLPEAIASVERGVTVPYDLRIVNDGSRDPHTLEVLARLRQAGYRVIDQDNRGLAEARNRGIREANRPFYLPLDADNRLRPGFVEAALDALARDERIAAVYGDRVEFGLREGRVQVGVPDLDLLLCGNYIDACALMRTDAWRACAGYDPDMPAQGAEDWDLWLSLLARDWRLLRLDLAAFDYRVRPDSMLARAADPEIHAAIERYVVGKHASFYLRHLRAQVDRLRAAHPL